MGVMDKFLNYMKINDDDNDLDDDYDEVDPVVDTKVKKASFKESVTYDNDEESSETVRQQKPVAKVTQMRQTRKITNGGNDMQVCVIKPTTVEESREITETLLQNRTVVLNLEGLDVDIAQRIIDFTSGSCFAIDGNLQKISHYIFIITPASVDISGDFQDIINGSLEVPSL